MDFAPLPASRLPTVEQIAGAIAAGFPLEARARAELLLASVVLPWDLRALSTFPTPRRLIEIVYRALVDELARVEPTRRGSALELVAYRRAGLQVNDRAVGLAVARWALDHPSVILPGPWETATAPYLGLDRAALQDEAVRLHAAIVALERDAGEAGRVVMRSCLPGARAALTAARHGWSGSEAGVLAVFLRDVTVAAATLAPPGARARTGEARIAAPSPHHRGGAKPRE